MKRDSDLGMTSSDSQSSALGGADDSSLGSSGGLAETPVTGRRHVSIEPNGREYLVTINGAVFVALSAAQAESMRRRATLR